MLGTKLVALEKKKGEYIYREKYKEEKKKNASYCSDFINESISLHLWSNQVEIWRICLKLK